MSNILIVVNRANADLNSLNDIAGAVVHAGATVCSVDEQCHMIEAVLPAAEVPTVKAMEGVSYVRCVFNYFRDPSTQRSAA